MSRRRAREAILQLLYARDLGGNPRITVHSIAEAAELQPEEIEYTINIFDSIVKKQEIIDEEIQRNLRSWHISRLSVLDRNILRLAVAELFSGSEIPKQVVINEAVELAKTYCEEDAFRYINGVLGNIEIPKP